MLGSILQACGLALLAAPACALLTAAAAADLPEDADTEAPLREDRWEELVVTLNDGMTNLVALDTTGAALSWTFLSCGVLS